jgi:DNA-binding XRE family transcriptional regulator
MKERIIRLMKEMGMNASQFADATGISRGVISHIMRDRYKPSRRVLEMILARFDAVNPEWLISGKGEMWRNAANGNLKSGNAGIPRNQGNTRSAEYSGSSGRGAGGSVISGGSGNSNSLGGNIGGNGSGNSDSFGGGIGDRGIGNIDKTSVITPSGGEKDLFSPPSTATALSEKNETISKRNISADIRIQHTEKENRNSKEVKEDTNDTKIIEKEIVVYKDKPSKVIDKLVIFYSDKTFETFVMEI